MEDSVTQDLGVDDLAEHSVIGRYRVVQRLGEGGMGVVHLALDRQGRAVALKVLRSLDHHDTAARARLRREVDALRRIASAHVATIIDADIDGPIPYVVTRWVPGPALDDVVDGHGPLAPKDLHRVAVGLASAIDAIHAAAVVHRDVKPANVLLLEGDPVLIDFGIAHLTDDVRLTSVGLVMGTPGYLAPEIIEGGQVTPATDWWGWAASLAYAASGRPPFGRGAMDAVLARVSRGDPDLDGVDPRLAPLLHAALSPRAGERPHRDEVVRALEVYAHGGDVTDVIRVRPAAPQTQVLTAGSTARLPVAAPAQGTPTPAPPPPASRMPVSPSPMIPAVRPAAPPVPSVDPRSVPATARQLPPMPLTDPRIGQPMRSRTIGALLAVGVVAAAMAPVWAFVAVFVWMMLARSVDRSMTALLRRRLEHGQRPRDLALSAVSSPWHLVLGAVTAIGGLAVPLLVAVTASFSAALILGALVETTPPTSALALGVGGLLGLLMAWWGPGGASFRRGTRSIVRGVSPTPTAVRALLGVIALIGIALLVWGLVGGSAPSWAPVGPPSNWTTGA